MQYNRNDNEQIERNSLHDDIQHDRTNGSEPLSKYDTAYFDDSLETINDEFPPVSVLLRDIDDPFRSDITNDRTGNADLFDIEANNCLERVTRCLRTDKEKENIDLFNEDFSLLPIAESTSSKHNLHKPTSKTMFENDKHRSLLSDLYNDDEYDTGVYDAPRQLRTARSRARHITDNRPARSEWLDVSDDLLVEINGSPHCRESEQTRESEDAIIAEAIGVVDGTSKIYTDQVADAQGRNPSRAHATQENVTDDCLSGIAMRNRRNELDAVLPNPMDSIDEVFSPWNDDADIFDDFDDISDSLFDEEDCEPDRDSAFESMKTQNIERVSDDNDNYHQDKDAEPNISGGWDAVRTGELWDNWYAAVNAHESARSVTDPMSQKTHDIASTLHEMPDDKRCSATETRDGSSDCLNDGIRHTRKSVLMVIASVVLLSGSFGALYVSGAFHALVTAF